MPHSCVMQFNNLPSRKSIQQEKIDAMIKKQEDEMYLARLRQPIADANKFNLNIGDFIKVAKEASEISKKLSIIYEDDTFEDINKIFDNNLIQKTMS